MNSLAPANRLICCTACTTALCQGHIYFLFAHRYKMSVSLNWHMFRLRRKHFANKLSNQRWRTWAELSSTDQRSDARNGWFLWILVSYICCVYGPQEDICMCNKHIIVEYVIRLCTTALKSLQMWGRYEASVLQVKSFLCKCRSSTESICSDKLGTLVQ